MIIQKRQRLKRNKIIFFTLSLLVNISSQVYARENGEFDDSKSIICSQKPAIKVTHYTSKIGVIDLNFDPRSDTRGSLTQSAEEPFLEEDPGELAWRAHKEGKDHANHVSSIIYHIVPDLRLRMISLRDEPSIKDEPSYNVRLIKAIDGAIKSKVDFINISLKIHPDNDENGKISRNLRKAFYKARDAGIGIIKSAGNDGREGEFLGSTAYTRSLVKLLHKMEDSMLMVVATNDEGKICDFSTRAGLGANYVVAALGNEVTACGAGNQLVKMSGTSMAAPVVTGTAALLKEAYPDLTASEILKSIRRSARQISFHQKNRLSEDYGCGIIDFPAALKEAKKIYRLKFSGRR